MISSEMAASNLLLNITISDASETRPRKRVRRVSDGDADGIFKHNKVSAISMDKPWSSPRGSSSGFIEPKQESKVNTVRNESIGLQSFLNKK